MIIIAHNIRSLHNVGAILRNAAAFDVGKVYLTGITGTPPRKEIAKVALGAQDLIPWEAGDIQQVIAQLKADGCVVYGLEQHPNAMKLDVVPNEKIALVLGNEVEGIDEETLEQLDGCIEIPMGKKRSLNVSVASGIAMYALSGHGQRNR